jgi:hypothetical protein
MTESQSSRPLSPSGKSEFLRCLDTIEEEVRRLPQNLCVLFTHTPLTEDGSRYSLFEGKGHKLGCHWLESGLLPEYPLVGYPPEMLPFGTDRFPFGDVLSRSSWLFELFEDTQHRNWLNFGGECGFYVALQFDKDPDPEQARKRVRDSLPEDAVAQAQSERIIWHYFVNHIDEPIPPEVTFASVNEQLEHCYHGIRETLGKFLREHSLEEHDTLSLINYELAWPEMLLYLGLKRPGPFFGVDTTSILRSFEGAELVPWSRPDECHHVFKMRPPSVARATLWALKVLRLLVDPANQNEAATNQAATNQADRDDRDAAKPESGFGSNTSAAAAIGDDATVAKSGKSRLRRSTADLDTLLATALTEHHGYNDGKISVFAPLTFSKLKKKTGLADGSLVNSLKRAFPDIEGKAHAKYRMACQRKKPLVIYLIKANGHSIPNRQEMEYRDSDVNSRSQRRHGKLID